MIRCRSVTPADAGAQDVLAGVLQGLGFTLHRLRFGETENLFARRGESAPHFCFAGHTDVVPAGDGWAEDAFGGALRGGCVVGRGAVDMKGAIAAFIAAVSRVAPWRAGSVSLLITGDEEGPGTDGTVRVLDWMRAAGQVPDACLVGEPTNPARLGDMIKVGRRGSLNAVITVHGVQGHAAYPQRADNPVHRLLAVLGALTAAPLDEGTEFFEPSGLQIVSVDVGNPVFNVIPARATARLNIRFNDRHSGASLTAWLRETVAAHAPAHELAVTVSGEAFLTSPGRLTGLLAEAVREVTGRVPALDTGGGTSDARFIAGTCPVAEFGLVGATMHKADEQVAVRDLEQLTEIYALVLRRFLDGAA